VEQRRGGDEHAGAQHARAKVQQDGASQVRGCGCGHTRRLAARLLDVKRQDSSRGSTDNILEVTSVAAARLVLDPARRRYLEPFVGRERTPAEAARDLDAPVEQLAYRVQAMQRHRLLRAVAARPRAGRTSLVYRAPDEVRVPLSTLDEGDVRDFFRTLDTAMRETFFAALATLAGRAGLGDWTIRLYRDEQDRIRLDLAPDGGSWDMSVLGADRAPAVLFHWIPLSLDQATAKQLQRELSQVIERHLVHVPTPDRAPDHLLGVFLTPLPNGAAPR
jgi:hypothetical protein